MTGALLDWFLGCDAFGGSGCDEPAMFLDARTVPTMASGVYGEETSYIWCDVAIQGVESPATIHEAFNLLLHDAVA